MTNKTLEELDIENEKLVWTVKYFQALLVKTREENDRLRKLLLDRGVKHE